MTSTLSHRIERRQPIGLVTLSGQLDSTTAPMLRSALFDALASEPTTLVVDLSGFSVADPSLLTVFTDVAEEAWRWPGARLLLCHASPRLTETLRQTGVHPRIPLVSTRTAALQEAAKDPVPPRLHRRLAPTLYAPRVAREVAAHACAQWGLSYASTAAQILCSELVTNAVRHAGTIIDLTVSLRDGALRVSVRDGYTRPPRMRTPEATDDSGRGLLIVDTVASSWGTVPVPGGKLVWAALSLVRSPHQESVAVLHG